MSDKVLKIFIGIPIVIGLAILSVLAWTKFTSPATMEIFEREIEANKAKQAERAAYTIYILKDSYKLIPGKFDRNRKPDELIEIKDIKQGLGDFLLEGNKYVVYFKETPESEFEGMIDLLDVLSAIKGLQYAAKEISQEEVEFLKRAQKAEAQ